MRVTTSGNASLFHGVPDWVYEEEVFSADYALWWSPDSSKVAFLRFDETAVDEFTFPIYNPSEDSYAVVPYPDTVTMKYPKPGYNNPLVSVHVFEMDSYLSSVRQAGSPSNINTTQIAQQATIELTWDGRQAADNSIIAEVAWVSPSALLIKEVTRAAQAGSIIYFDLSKQPSNVGKAVRKLGKDGEQGDDGWIESVRPREYATGSPTDHLVVASDLSTRTRAFARWSCSLPRHRPDQGRIQPYCLVQPGGLGHPTLLDFGRVGGHE